jgi:hypothetical protein
VCVVSSTEKMSLHVSAKKNRGSKQGVIPILVYIRGKAPYILFPHTIVITNFNSSALKRRDSEVCNMAVERFHNTDATFDFCDVAFKRFIVPCKQRTLKLKTTNVGIMEN